MPIRLRKNIIGVMVRAKNLGDKKEVKIIVCERCLESSDYSSIVGVYIKAEFENREDDALFICDKCGEHFKANKVNKKMEILMSKEKTGQDEMYEFFEELLEKIIDEQNIDNLEEARASFDFFLDAIQDCRPTIEIGGYEELEEIIKKILEKKAK